MSTLTGLKRGRSQLHQSVLSQLNQSEAKFEELKNEINILYEHVPFGTHSLDTHGTYLSINSQELAWLGYTREEVVGKMKFTDFLSSSSQERYGLFFQDSVISNFIEGLELELIGKDGLIRHTQLSVVIKRYSGHAIGESRSIIFDITERKKREESLRTSTVAFKSQEEEEIVITDVEGTILRVNPIYCDSCGHNVQEIISKNPRILQSGLQNPDFYTAMWKSVVEKGFWEGDIWNRGKTGETFPERLLITALKNSDEIQHLAFYDMLTHLPNRRLLIERLKQSLASSARTGQQGALLFVDLDNFKIMNDTLGHDIGDILLQQAARRIESSVREGDTVARYGGDEFVVILGNLSKNPQEASTQTKAVGTKILVSLNLTYQLETHAYLCTASIGATLFQGHEEKIDELLKQADIAMYQVKKDGRRGMRFFDPKMQEQINSRAALESELRSAIKNHEFRLHYQIQMDSTHKALGAECLIRWLHPKLGVVAPAQFIALAEETGLILPIGEWVLETACAQLQSWQQNALTRELTLSVNVSAKQFYEPSFVTQVKTAVLHYGINPLLLKLEPTKSILLENIADTVATMNALKAIGVRFALDDFGMGFSSFQYLKKLPWNQFKIDQTFVRDLTTDLCDGIIVRTIIAIAQSFNLEVIAEGIETEQQQQVLQSYGCNHFQGYRF
ncbi:MAG: EAL domain-containing protein, partial [Ferrovum sp.]|nr:EAL domain-containing protein [Ferrovum sp.]